MSTLSSPPTLATALELRRRHLPLEMRLHHHLATFRHRLHQALEYTNALLIFRSLRTDGQVDLPFCDSLTWTTVAIGVTPHTSGLKSQILIGCLLSKEC
jgi:hypothetical protein